MVCFAHFNFQMFFAPEWPALFRHLNFQKVVGAWCFFAILTSNRASGHNGVQFSPLISPYGYTPAALASLLFDPPELQKIRKTVFHDLSTFLRT
jgi:hypothetical protein